MQTDSRKRTRCFYLLTLITIIVALIGCSSGGSGNGTDQAPLSLEIRGNDWLITNGDSTPSQIDGTEFGPTPENGSETHTFTLYNKAAVAISINSIELTGDAHFSTDTSALTLKPGDESDITVVFTPAGATRNAEATITLETSGASYTFALLGTTRAIWGETAWWVATEKDQETWGRIYFDPDAVVRSNATEQDLKEIAEVAAGVRRDFALMDNDAYSKRVDPDILRFTSEEKYTVGAAEAMEAIEWEWIGRERPVEPVIAVSETFNDFELWVDGDGAVASYVLDQVYGARWIEHGRYRIFQAFSKGDDGWKLAVQHDAGDLTEIEEGTSVLFFDWAYPVKDLERATAWYENFFGEPQVSTSSRTTWNLDMANFHLDTTDLAGHVNIIEGMPNGYAIIYTTNDIEAEHDRLEALGVDISTEVLTDWGPDPYFVAMDPVGNPFVWMQRVGQNDPTGDAPGLTIENPGNIPDDLFAEIEALFTDWVSADAQSVGERMPENGIWCDAYGFAWGRGPDEAQTALTAMFTDKSNGRVFDTTPNGLDLDIVATSMNLRNIGPFTIITLDLDITWRGAHNFHELASAALTYRQNGEEWGLVHVFISPGAFPGEMVWSLDYTGYPISRGNLDAAEDFYTNTLSFGTPYTDFAYFGYWSADSVFGIYQTGPGRDGMPRPGETSGYASFWVGSAQEAFDKLESLGADFPIIWAINGVSGIEYVPGYTQLYTVDSEGNGMLFSEYPGD